MVLLCELLEDIRAIGAIDCHHGFCICVPFERKVGGRVYFAMRFKS